MNVHIETWPADSALALARAHRQLNPGHTLVVSYCEKCGQPMGIFCCRDFICAIESDCED